MSARVRAVFAAPLLDHTGLDLDAAHRITYRVEQRFRYTYDAPVTSLSQRLVIVPRPRHGDLYRRAHLVEVTGTHTRRRTHQDSAGNTDHPCRTPANLLRPVR
jgi:Bacterial transglutaminase-like N-terminal region